MCGFVAGSTRCTLSAIDDALNVIAHRGPDDHQVYRDQHAFLGHRRLSIVDVQGGIQPLTSEDHNIVAVVNGEFYDFEPLRQSLMSKGHRFKTHSDSEILVHLYEEYGTQCLHFLHGEFAFVLYDKKKNLWFAARDRMGVRPLHYSLDKDVKFIDKEVNSLNHGVNPSIVFASEAKSILSLQGGGSLNRDNVWFSQHFQYLPQNGTFFNNIHMVPPAHYAVFHDNKLSTHCYWEFPSTITSDSFEVASEKVEHLLRAAVTRRIPHEVAWCSHLSGGIDSSIVSLLGGAKNCFTVAFTDDEFYNELPLAKEVALRIGAKLHVVPVTFTESLNAMSKAIYHAEGLSINGHLGAKYLLNSAIHDAGFKVALSGEGSDEIFMGYSHLKQDFLSAEVLGQMEKTYLSGVQLPSGNTLDLSLFKEQAGFVPTWVKAKSSIAFKLSSLWHPEFTGVNPVGQFLRESGAAGMLEKYGKNKAASLLWSRYCLSGYILKVLDDAQAMASSVEGRLPFLDTQLMEYVWSLPDDYYFTGNIEKTMLRNIFKDALPSSVINKTKQSFMSPPLQRALKNSASRELIYGTLLENASFEKQHLFDRAQIEKSLKNWQHDDNPSAEPVLMTLLSLAMLCKEFSL